MKLKTSYLALFACIGIGLSITNAVKATNSNGEAMPSTPIPKEQANACQLTMLFPRILTEEANSIGCEYEKTNDGFNAIVSTYYVNGFASPQTARRMEMDIYEKSIDTVIKNYSESTIYRDEHGELDTGFDAPETCHTADPHTIVTPLTGPNWHGWVVEEAFDKPKHKIINDDCLKFTPSYRCVSLLIGNDKMSLTLSGYCFLRKHEDSLQTELSYDIFMDMIKSIHFNNM